MKNLLVITLLLLSSISWVHAQDVKKPAPSPHQVLTQDFALSKITIDYSRPSVKGRTIFGDLVPYDKVWRTGANAITTIEFGHDVKLEGHDVKAGKYALYSIPTKNGWTIILNKDVKNWGTEYKEADDVLRFKVPSLPMSVKVETFTINIDSIRDNSAIIYLIWDNVFVPIQVTAQISKTAMTQIREGMKNYRKAYSSVRYDFVPATI